jgi:hypothetical protein
MAGKDDDLTDIRPGFGSKEVKSNALDRLGTNVNPLNVITGMDKLEERLEVA